MRPLFRWLARTWLPPSLRLAGMRRAYMRMLGHLARDPDPAVQQGVIAAAEQLGAELADDLRASLGLGDSLADADTAWAVGCQAFGLSFVRDSSAGRITYDHTGCQLHAFYAAQGECHCETVCLPMVRSVTAALAPSIEMTLDRAPDVTRGCRKSLAVKP